MISGKLLFNSDVLLFQTDSQAGMLLRFLSPICNFEALTQETGKERHGKAWRRCIGRTNRHDQLGSRRLGLALVVHLTDLPTIKLHQAKPPQWYLYFPTTFVIGSFNHNALAASEKKKRQKRQGKRTLGWFTRSPKKVSIPTIVPWGTFESLHISLEWRKQRCFHGLATTWKFWSQNDNQRKGQ